MNTGIPCSSQHLRWRATSCQSNMASKFNGTTSHRNGGHQNLNIIAPQLPTTRASPAAGGYQPLVPPAIPPPGSFEPPPPKTPTQPFNWRSANWVDECHPKIAAVMEPLLTKYQGRCSVSNILTSGNKRFDSLPCLDTYPGGVCWLHSIATCPYGPQCSFAVGHVKKGEITDTLADEVVGAIQAGVTELVNRPRTTSPLRKCKWRGQE